MMMIDGPTFRQSELAPEHLAAIPAELKGETRWVNWKAELTEKGKWTKVPIKPNGSRKKAASTRPQDWGSFEQALATYKRDRDIDMPHRLYGIGFVLGDGWVGVDLDHMLRDGALHPWGAALVAKLGTYAEVSPSGDGIKMIARTSVPLVRPDGKLDKDGNPQQGGSRKNYPEPGMAVESYAGGRFFTVTGRRWPCT